MSVSAQVNSWTKPSSGNWEEPFWSLGAAPGTNGQEVVALTNAGWKAVAIGPSTVRDSPQTLNVRNLTISSPVDSANTLFLNYAGLEKPLRVYGSLYVEPNSSLLAMYSALHVLGAIYNSGTVNHREWAEVQVDSLIMGERGPGIYSLSNGTLSAQQLVVGRYGLSQFFHDAGKNSAGTTHIRNGEYQLRQGEYSSGHLLISAPWNNNGSAAFSQSAGIVILSNGMTIAQSEASGGYNLFGGQLKCGPIMIGLGGPYYGMGGDGSFLHIEGTNDASTLTLGSELHGHGAYHLSNGTVRTLSTSLGGGGGFFHQRKGTHQVNGPLRIQGAYDRQWAARYSAYYLHGGELAADSLTMEVGHFVQNGGTNKIAGSLRFEQSVEPCIFELYGGLLSVSNVVLWGGYLNSVFSHSNGVHNIAYSLELGGPSPGKYIFDAGALNSPVITIHKGSSFVHNGGTLQNSGSVVLDSGKFQAGAAISTLGRLALIGTQPGAIAFSSSPSTVAFQNSADTAWGSGSALHVIGWQGALAGGGSHRLLIGNSAQGLSSPQTSRITFIDPSGLPPGMHPAKILPTGEIVPATPAATYSNFPGKLVVSWDGPFVLQTATNVAGPYSDVFDAKSPYTNLITSEPERYFRLRR